MRRNRPDTQGMRPLSLGFMIFGLGISGFLIVSTLSIVAVMIGSPLATVGAALSDIHLPELATQRHSTKPWGRDPFSTPSGKSKGLSGGASNPGATADPDSTLNLSAIIKGEGKGEGVAIINGEILRKGDHIGDKKVMEVRGDRVIIQDRFGTLELKINTLAIGYEPVSQGRTSSGKRPDMDRIADGP